MEIEGDQVTLDLNGFAIFIVNNFAFPGHRYYPISGFGFGVTIRNGHIRIASASVLSDVSRAYGISLDARYVQIEGITIFGETTAAGVSFGLALGTGTIVRGVSTNLFSGVGCPSVLIGTSGVNAGSSCVTVGAIQ